MTGPRTAVVIATRNRADELLRTLQRLETSADGTPIIVVDNASTDGTPERVRRGHPAVTVVGLGRNLGAAARNLGARRARTPYIAFNDDDSWWAEGSLAAAETAFDRHPRLGLLTARTLVGPQQRPDPVTPFLAHSPLGQEPDLPGPSVLGFLACSAVVRREAFLQVGGFSPVLFFVGEERLLAWDLAAAGWALCYVEDLVVHHHPSPHRGPANRRRRAELRNLLLTAWMRRDARTGLAATAALARDALRDPTARGALAEALVRSPAALCARRALPRAVEQQVRLLEEAHR
ncbi:glycosyltransferase [Pseudonocardia acidicola]|uniref:Glycosyltransferase n=1 Tax=Pseudonocardia acidicola TaxID=2724939 RepID=A0ABX1S9Z6_9PSEU|nr:glycosyltransferase [Pseudonocardia acidicola]